MKAKTLSLVQIEKINQIDQLLPQTQCGQCGFTEGCRPYAQAIIQSHEPANLCVPGGQPLADKLASLLKLEPQPCAPSSWPVNPLTERPVEVEAAIDETLCIGCFKCVTACLVDAIVGAAKLMHTVIAEDCTGCELCLEPCPVDCIELIVVGTQKLSNPHQREQFKERYARHQSRLSSQVKASKGSSPIVSAKQTQASSAVPNQQLSAGTAKQRIEAAKIRTQLAKLRRNQKSMIDRGNSPSETNLIKISAQIRVIEEQLDALSIATVDRT